MMLAPRAWLDRFAPPAAAGAVLLAAWEYLPSFFGVPVLLMPPPSSVARALWAAQERGLLLENALITLAEALTGFVIGSALAVFFAFLITRSTCAR